MKNPANDSDNETAPGIILADDSAPQHSAALLPDDGASEEAAKLILSTADGVSIGALSRSLLARFLGTHKKELDSFSANEQEKRTCISTNKFYQEQLAEWKLRMDILEKKITSYQKLAKDLPMTLLKNCWEGGFDFLQVASDPQVLACLLLEKHGSQMMALVKLEYENLQQKYVAFRREHRPMLQQLGLL